jgi:hypothetical protein
VKTAFSLYLTYTTAKIFLAGRHDYDIEADYTVYSAMGRNDMPTIQRVYRARMKKAGITSKQVKFTKLKKGEHGEKVKLSHAWCKRRYEREHERYLEERYGTPERRAEALRDAPMHLKSVTGKQGDKKKAGTLVGNFTVKRPKKVETPFGGEADNREVFG